LRLFFFLAVLYTFSGFSQELPPVINYNAATYDAGNQNWMISQAENKNLYIANGTGLLEFNGAEWNLYPVPNNTIVRSVKVVGKKIFTGAYMEVGYWQENKYGTLDYTSLLDKFPEKVSDGEQFWHIENSEDIMIFQSFEKLYLYHLSRGDVTNVKTNSSSPITNLFKVEENIYYQQEGQGVFLIKNGKPELLIPSDVIGDLEFVHLSLRDNQLHIICKSGEFYTWNGLELIPFNEELTKTIDGLSIFYALDLADNSLVLGTVENGAYHVNSNGEVIENFNQTNGLLNNTVLSLFEDVDKNLWAGLDNGIGVVNLNSAFEIFQDKNGRIGSVYTSIKEEEYIYLGTNQGLYYKKNGDNAYTFIPGTNGQVWSLQKIDDILFCGHNTGTFIIKDGVAKKIADRSGTWKVIKLEQHPDFYLQGHYNGLSMLKRDGDEFKAYPMLKNFPHSSKSIVSNKNGDIWIGNEHKGVFKIRLDDSLSTISTTKNYPFKGVSAITSSIFKFNDTLYYTTKSNFFQYLPSLDEFNSKNELSKITADFKRISGTIVSDGVDKIWGFTESSIFNLGLSQLSSGYNLTPIYLPKEVRNITIGHENITRLDSDKYLIGVSNGYLIYNQMELTNQKYQIKINKITSSTVEKNVVLVPLNKESVFTYKSNNININYNVSEYEKFISPEYSYRLIGLSSTWSEWDKTPMATFKNLSFGDYDFQVKGKIGTNTTETVSYQFRISRPWYLSWIAIACYILLFLAIIALIHRSNLRHHRKINEEKEKELKLKNLEVEQKIIKLQNEQLEKDMSSKNKELAVSTMSLIKKNEFLSNIKDQLKESESSKVKSVIKTIDKDINEEYNWNLFKDAFNNADKEFFKKIKSKHPDLTSNDLKVSAYLRLNLSSKEIAPLLNISVKSVEIKRYRLRKKMLLPREVNLTEYILAI
jgi:AraC family chitin signaling transcriptional activator